MITNVATKLPRANAQGVKNRFIGEKIMALQPMGLGKLGDSHRVFKRKFRWTFKVEDVCSNEKLFVPDSFVKLAARPNLTIEETEINRLNAKGWIPGKAAWETITVTYYDVADRANIPLWTWLASVYDFTDPFNLKMGSRRSDYAAKGVLKLYDGCGTAIEQWILEDLWPQAINFGELDYSSSEESNIELTLRYSTVKYTSFCPKVDIGGCCTECDAGASSTGSGAGGVNTGNIASGIVIV